MLSLVLPSHNEEKELGVCIDRLKPVLEKTGSYEIIIAEDGSTDRTYEVAKELARKFREITLMHSDEKLGRGRALKRAFQKAGGDIVGYMDVDLATDLRHVPEMVDYLREYDVVTGSRLMRGSRASRQKNRLVLSRGFNFLVRLVLGSRLHDHQCGFKGFRKSVIMELNRESEENHWFWDTEVLVLAQKRGYRVKEFPVEWNERPGTKVKIRRDVIDMGSSIFRLRSRLK
jgi:glycosyltransferase involved in cell wall biosynthesis